MPFSFFPLGEKTLKKVFFPSRFVPSTVNLYSKGCAIIMDLTFQFPHETNALTQMGRHPGTIYNFNSFIRFLGFAWIVIFRIKIYHVVVFPSFFPFFKFENWVPQVPIIISSFARLFAGFSKLIDINKRNKVSIVDVA